MSRFGSIGTQYFDDSGNPLISGKLYFYETGSATPKDTYADVNLSIPNTNPVELTAAGRQPNIFFSGSARAVLTDSAGQIEDRDPLGGDGSTGGFPAWNANTIYSQPDIVVGVDGNFYLSLIDNNVGKDPVTNPTDWVQVRFIRVWNTNETYAVSAVVQGSDGLLYSAVTGTNLGNNPVVDAVNWQPATTSNVPAVIRAAGKTYAYRNF